MPRTIEHVVLIPRQALPKIRSIVTLSTDSNELLFDSSVMKTGLSRTALIGDMDALHVRTCADQRRLFALIAEAHRRGLWMDEGARDMAHWLWMRYGLSDWKARRWIASALALERLPRISAAFARGRLGVDKVVELTRFATPETEEGLTSWAERVSAGCIRRRGDVETARTIKDAEDAERSRRVSWWTFDDGRRFGLLTELPAAAGANVARAIDRLAETLPIMPGEQDHSSVEARRADALVAMCSAQVAADPDPDRATVVVHASVDALASGDRGCQIEGGGIVHPETARRLLCDGRLQVVLEDGDGTAVGLGRLSRVPSAAMSRQLRYRDAECTFPGCGARRFTQAHHVTWWEHGGKTTWTTSS